MDQWGFEPNNNLGQSKASIQQEDNASRHSHQNDREMQDYNTLQQVESVNKHKQIHDQDDDIVAKMTLEMQGDD